MFAKSPAKVTFQDQQLDDYVLENSVLKSKLQSKIDALSIMSKELDKCSMERDRYKVLVDQLKRSKTVITRRDPSLYGYSSSDFGQGDLLTKTTDQNCLLKLEVESLRSQLEEATEDIVALRKELHRKDVNKNVSHKVSNEISNKDYEVLLQELEKIQNKYHQIQLDYRATLDEKEELSSDRDYYKTKVQRLNKQISYVLTNRTNMVEKSENDGDGDPPKPIVDIDAIVMENKYLHERITQLEVEKEIIKRTVNKYKTLLDNRSNKDERTLNLRKGFLDVMTQKQVREFLDMNSKTGFKRSSVAELKSLCLGLFEALNDKSIALQHQRKTNQILANRINELEKTLESWCNGQKYIPIFPSQLLLEEFLPEQSSEDIKGKLIQEPKENLTENDEGNSVSVVWDGEKGLTTKTVLPLELELLVKEALAEMNFKHDN